MKKIILTGGGTAGHVTPNLALIPSLREAGYDIRYIGSYQGMERKLIENAGIPYDLSLIHISTHAWSGLKNNLSICPILCLYIFLSFALSF